MAPRPRALVVALALAAASAPTAAGDPDDALDDGQQLAAALALVDAGRVDEGVAMLAELIDRSPASPEAGEAALLLLDALHRDGRVDELEAWLRGLRERPSLLAASPKVAQAVDLLLPRLGLQRAYALERTARTSDDPDDFQRCGDAYLAVEAGGGDGAAIEQALVNASVCLARAGAVDEAAAALARLIAEHPSSMFVGLAYERLGQLHAAIGELGPAADAFEALARRATGGPGEADALRAAIRYRLALGDLPAAERDVEAALAAVGAHAYEPPWTLSLAMAAAYLGRDARGDRARARGWLVRTARGPWTMGTLDPWQMRAAGRLFRDGACPVAPTDGLCVDGAGAAIARDRALAAAGQRAAEAIAHEGNPMLAGWARIALADERLERVMALPAPPRGAAAHARLTAAADDARAAYRAIADDPAADGEARVIAHARLGQLGELLAAHTGAPADVASYRRCQALAIERTAGASWLALCDRRARALGDPDPRPRETLPALATTLAPPAR